jgi:hypothetical protein
MTILSTTVSEWLSHFSENPNQTIAEYQVDWTTIRNNSEGAGVNVSWATADKYIRKFKDSLNLNSNSEPIVEAVPLNPIATILETKANIVGLRVSIEKYLTELATIESTLDNALAIASDNALFARLESENINLAKDVTSQRDRANLAEDNVKAERELRIRQGETHSGSTR